MEVTTPLDHTSSHRSSWQLRCEQDVRHLGDLILCHHYTSANMKSPFGICHWTKL